MIPGPRGRKSWALVTRLALSSRPVPRREFTSLLFADADDPLGALRWALSEARRALQRSDVLLGDPLALPGQDEVAIDVRALDGPTPDAIALAGDAGELLAGWDFPGCPEFEAWLASERHRAKSRIEAHLRDAAMTSIASGDANRAVGLASRAVVSNPLDEALQELLVRALSRAGDRTGALEQVARCERTFLDELGIALPPAVRAAADDRAAADSGDTAPVSPAATTALLDSGQAAVDAGAIDAGVDALRRAAQVAPDDPLRAAALLALGSALVHGLRGRDEEGALVLHEAVQSARRAGDRGTAVAALRELAFVDVQAGRAATVATRLDEAEELAGDDDRLRSGLLGIRGMHESDRGNQVPAMDALRASIASAETCGDRRQRAWSQAILGRSLLLSGDLRGASAQLEESVAGCRNERWLAFLPFPLAMRAEVGLALDEPIDRQLDLFDESFALGCQLGDPCWEGLAGAGLARVALGGGEGATAWERVTDAHRRCVRHPDRYVWIEAWVLAAVRDVAIATDRDDAAANARSALAELASRTEQPPIAARLGGGRWAVRAPLS